MCKSIWVVGASEPMVHGIDQLMALVGCDDIREIADFTDEGTELRPYDCLCGVNVAECLVDFGFRVWKQPKGDSMEYWCEPLPASNG